MTGRKVFYHAEYAHLVTAENILVAYQSRSRTEDWAAWANEKPQLFTILAEATKLYAHSRRTQPD